MITILNMPPSPACNPNFHHEVHAIEKSHRFIEIKSEPIFLAAGKMRRGKPSKSPISVWNEAIARLDFVINSLKLIKKQIIDDPSPLKLKNIHLIGMYGFEKCDVGFINESILKIDILDPINNQCHSRRSLDLILQFDRPLDRNLDEIRFDFLSDSDIPNEFRSCPVEWSPQTGSVWDDGYLKAFISKEELGKRTWLIKIAFPVDMAYQNWNMMINMSIKKDSMNKYRSKSYAMLNSEN